MINHTNTIRKAKLTIPICCLKGRIPVTNSSWSRTTALIPAMPMRSATKLSVFPWGLKALHSIRAIGIMSWY